MAKDKMERRELLSWAWVNFCWENWEECKNALNEFVSTVKKKEAMDELSGGMKEIDKWWVDGRKEVLSREEKEGWISRNPGSEIEFTQLDIVALHKFLVLCESVAEKYKLI